MLKFRIQNTEVRIRGTRDDGRGTNVFRPSSFVLRMLILCFLPSVCNAQSLSSAELINNAKLYDGKAVTYSGEVIGDVMLRKEFAWVNISDGESALGVWLPKDLTKEIIYKGSFKSVGDWVELSGIFNRACNEHGGDLDIHAQTLRKINPGRAKAEEFNPSKRNFVFLSAALLCIVLILTQLKLG